MSTGLASVLASAFQSFLAACLHRQWGDRPVCSNPYANGQLSSLLGTAVPVGLSVAGQGASECMQNNGESESSEVPAKPVIKKKRLIWDIQIDPDDADMAGASEEAIKMMTQSRRVSFASSTTLRMDCLSWCAAAANVLGVVATIRNLDSRFT